MTLTDAPKRTVRVFVSSVAADRHWTDGYLVPALRDASVTVVTEEAFRPGRPRLAEFEEAISSSDYVVLVLSPAYFADDGATIVDLMAQHYGMDTGTWPVIPIVLQQVDVPLRLRVLTPVDATTTDAWTDAVGRLIRAVGSVPATPAPPPPCPYPGMTAFGPERAAQFFGREPEVDDATARLAGGTPGLCVVGPSGSGKSSLLLAGVAPRLTERGWLVHVVRPGDLTAASAAPLRDDDGHGLLIVDQLEEAFRPDVDLDAVVAAVERWWSAPRHAVAVTMRADFYPQLMSSPLWSRLRDYRLEVVPMDHAAIRRAITMPSLGVDVFVEPTLVERLAADAADEPGSLPLLQETLVLLWEHLERRMLPLSAYEAFVLPRRHYGDPPRTGLQVAMARRADRALAALDDDQQRTARRIFVRLVHFDDARMLRRRQRIDELMVGGDDTAAFDAVLAHLAAARLVTLDSDARGGGVTVDLAHEALITGWPRFAEWLDERRAHEDARRRLEAKASEWRRLGGAEGGLLDDVELAEADRWLGDEDEAADEASDDLRALVSSSRAALDAHRTARRTARRRLFVLSIVAAMLIVATPLLLLLATEAQRDAGQARVEARANELAVSAEAQPDQYVDQAMLLGVAAHQLHPDDFTRSGLLSAVTRNEAVVRQFHTTAPVRALAVVDDVLALGGRDGDVELRQLGTWQRLGSLRVPEPRVLPNGEPVALRSLAVAPDGTLLGGTNDGRVTGWDVDSGRVVGAPEQRHTGSVRALAFGRDGQFASGSAPTDATAGTDPVGPGRIIVTDVDGRSRRLDEHRDWVNALLFTPDGRWMISAGGATSGRSVDHRILIWSTSTWQVDEALDGHADAVRSLAITPDGALLASADAEGRVLLWDLDARRRTDAVRGHDERVFSVAFLGDGDRLASASRDHTVAIWDVDRDAGTVARAPRVLRGHDGGVGALVDTGVHLVSGGDDDRVVVWDLRADRHRLAQRVDDRRGAVVAASADGRSTAVAAIDGVVELGGAAAGPAVVVGAPVRSLALDDGGAMLVAATADGRLAVFDTATSQRLATARTGAQGLVVAVDRAGAVLTGDASGAVTRWSGDLRTRDSVGAHGAGWAVSGIAPLGDGVVVSTGLDGRLLAHDADGAEPVVLDPVGGQFTATAALPAGTLALAGDVDGLLQLWDVSRPEQPVQRLGVHDAPIAAIAVSVDGRMVASGDDAGVLALWDVTDGRLRPLGAPIATGSRISSLGFSVDGTLLAGGPEGAWRWSMHPDAWRDVACATAGRDLSPAERLPYAPELDDVAVCPDQR